MKCKNYEKGRGSLRKMKEKVSSKTDPVVFGFPNTIA
jgi:PHD/YefM family antitoxin component YafN of YafNO toxin-antitoxin module